MILSELHGARDKSLIFFPQNKLSLPGSKKNHFISIKQIKVPYENNDKKMESVYSKRIKAGKRRTYFFDVRETRGNDFYLTITESRKRFDSDGYDRHKIFLYKEDFNKFIKGLVEAVDHVKTELMPDFDFDAFNHDTPYEGEDGQGGEVKPILSEPIVDKEPESTAAHIDSEEQTIVVPPVDNGNAEEVDKW